MITLKTLKEATKQQVFEQVAKHLLTQYQRSINEFGYCMYRGQNGCKCAAGCLIADDEYMEYFEDKTWNTLVVKNDFPSNHKEIIRDLQDIHDCFIVQEWKEELKDLGKKYDLSIDFIEEFE